MLESRVFCFIFFGIVHTVPVVFAVPMSDNSWIGCAGMGAIVCVCVCVCLCVELVSHVNALCKLCIMCNAMSSC